MRVSVWNNISWALNRSSDITIACQPNDASIDADDQEAGNGGVSKAGMYVFRECTFHYVLGDYSFSFFLIEEILKKILCLSFSALSAN